MKVKLGYGALDGVVALGTAARQPAVSISGGEALVQRADELYRAGHDADARAVVREALQAALMRVEQKYGNTGHDPVAHTSAIWELA